MLETFGEFFFSNWNTMWLMNESRIDTATASHALNYRELYGITNATRIFNRMKCTALLNEAQRRLT